MAHLSNDNVNAIQNGASGWDTVGKKMSLQNSRKLMKVIIKVNNRLNKQASGKPMVEFIHSIGRCTGQAKTYCY